MDQGTRTGIKAKRMEEKKHSLSFAIPISKPKPYLTSMVYFTFTYSEYSQRIGRSSPYVLPVSLTKPNLRVFFYFHILWIAE